MAIYHFKTTPISRGSGHSATAKAAYICRDKIKDETTGKTHKYNSEKMRADLVYSEIYFKGAKLDITRSELWNKAEKAENRKDSRVGREFLLALPKEFTKEQNIELVRGFCFDLTLRYNCIVDFAIHNDKDENGNIHAHILASTRKYDKDTNTFTTKTDLELDQKQCKKLGIDFTDIQIKKLRENWRDDLNYFLKQNGFDIILDCDKKEDRELVKRHLGKNANALEKKGIKTEKGNHNREIDEIIQLKTQIYNDGDKLAKLNAEIEELENKQAQLLAQQEKPAESKEVVNNRPSLIQPLENPIIKEPEKEKPTETKSSTESPAYSLQQVAPPKVAEKKPETKADNELKKQSYIDTGKLFDIARQHNDFFNKTVEGWKNKNQTICVNDNKVNVQPSFSNKDISLAIDVAQAKYETLSIKGTDSFQNAVYKELAINPKYQNIKVSDISKLEKAKQSITTNDMLDFYGRYYPKFIDQVKQNGVLENIGDNKRQIIDLKTATPQQVQGAMTDIIQRANQKKAANELLSQPLTTDRVMAYYEKINPDLVKQAKADGYITVKESGYMPSYTKLHESPREIADALGKATGHKLPSLNESTSDKVLNYYAKINPSLISEVKKDGGIMVKKDGFMPSFRSVKTDLKEVAEELAKRTGKALPQELNEQVKRAQQSMSKGISR